MSSTISSSNTSTNSPQYLRYWSLIVADDSGKGIELKDFAIRFVIHHSTYTFPHTADIRIYNLSSSTQSRIGTEFKHIQVVAGYLSNYGVVFQGNIKQVRIGRENATDGFTDIFAADGDQLHNYGVINASLPAGYTQTQVWAAIGTAAKPHNETAPLQRTPDDNPSPRGKVMYGMARDYMRDWANTNNQLVTVDNGVLTAMPLLAYKPGDAVVINSLTGMVGVPEQTENGITVTCLLNPAIGWGTRLQLNNDDITRNQIGNTPAQLQQQVVTGRPIAPIFPSLSADGFYKALAVDHVGETRGNPWYTQIICVALDPTIDVLTGRIPRTGGTTSLDLGDPPPP